MKLGWSWVVACTLSFSFGCACDPADPALDGGLIDADGSPHDDAGERSPEVCDNAIDDDGDGAIDCGDAECLAPTPSGPDTAPRTFLDQVRFLYEGTSDGACAGIALQHDVAAGLFDAERAAVVRGRVLDETGAPLGGARVEVIGEPTWGWTLSRADGQFDLVVHGGGTLRLAIVHPDRLPAERIAHPRWNDFTWVAATTLLRRSTVATRVELGGAMAIARGERVVDASGTRQTTLLFPASMQAFAQMPGGAEAPLSSMSVRVTEYTVGERGPSAMPAELPATSGYTYAFEAEIDEAVAMGASGVRFDRPAAIYAENFLSFPVGTPVPVGYYDRALGAWVPMENGRVLAVASIVEGRASFDLDGDGTADDDAAHDALGIGEDERAQIGTTYAEGAQLWRVTTTHFSLLDCNWPFGLPFDALAPLISALLDALLQPDACSIGGSIIECENRTLGETVPLEGSALGLHYRSDRVPGRADLYELRVRLADVGPLPPSLRRIETEVLVAGQRHRASFEPSSGAELVFRWDGRNAFGTRVAMAQPYTVRVGYVYGGVYMEPEEVRESFARFGYRGTASTTREEVTLWAEQRGFLGGIDARAQGLGGLTLSVQHAYDPVARVFYGGDGRRRGVDGLGQTIARFAGRPPGGPGTGDGGPATSATLWYPAGVAVAPDGTVYIADSQDHRVRAVAPDGTIRTVAGTGTSGNTGDGGAATSAQLAFPFGVTVGPRGDLYIVDSGNHRIRRVDAAGVIHAWAGSSGTAGFAGDGGPALMAQFDRPRAVVFAPDGRAFITDRGNARVRYVDVGGDIFTIAGRSTEGSTEDGILAMEAQLGGPSGIALAPDGGFYVAEQFGRRVRWVRADGVITTVAGSLDATIDGDGGRATEALVDEPVELAVAADGSLLIAQQGGRIRRVATDGVITTIAGGTVEGSTGVPGTALRARLSGSEGIAVGPDGTIYVAERLNSRVVRIEPALPRASVGDVVVPSEDGSELYVFDPGGRHLRTIDATLGFVRWELGYDAAGRFVSLRDGSANVYRVERDGAGAPSAIIDPYGRRSTLDLDAAGWTETVTSAAGRSWQLRYADANGLLETFTDASGAAWTFAYDDGPLRSDLGPEGMSWMLARELVREPDLVRETVSMTSALGRVHRGITEYRADGSRTRRTERMDGVPIEARLGADRVDETRHPDGTVIRIEHDPDPRFGMGASLVGRAIVTLPSGASVEVRGARTATLDDPLDRLSVSTLTSTITRGSSSWTNRFDAATRTWTSRSPRGRVTTVVLDELGHAIELRVPGLAPLTVAYDARGRPRELAQRVGDPALDRVIGIEHAISGAPDVGVARRVIDAELHATTFTPDAIARPERITLADGSELGLGWSALSRLGEVTPPSRSVHAITHDERGRIATYDPPVLAGRVDSVAWRYDDDGRPDLAELPDGTSIDWVYEEPTARGRLERIVTARGATLVRWDDAAGRIEGLTTPEGQDLRAAYDGARLEGVAWSGDVRGAVGFEYEPSTFRLSRITASGASGTPVPVDYGYDADDVLTSAGGMTITPDPMNALVRSTRVAMAATTHDPGPFADGDGMRATWPGGSFEWAVEARDRSGRIVALVETRDDGTPRRTVYGYDERGRLRTVDRDGTRVESYELDPNGNRTAWTNASGSSTATPDGRDRITSASGGVGATTYVHDEIGRVRERRRGAAVMRIDYDAFGALTSAALEDGRRIDYVVDALGRRVARRIGGTIERQWLYLDRLRPIAELDATGAVRSVFVYATRDHVPDLVLRGGRTYRIVTDPTGSVRVVVDAQSGAIAQELDYDTFGQVLRDTAPGFQPFGFAGGLYDPDTELVRFGARDYDPELGRWTARDPILFDAGQPNLYEYCGGDPRNCVDPSGLWVHIAAGAAGGALASIVWQLVTTGEVDAGSVVLAAAAGGLFAAASPAIVAAAAGDATLSMAMHAGLGSLLNVAQTFIGSGGRACASQYLSAAAWGAAGGALAGAFARPPNAGLSFSESSAHFLDRGAASALNGTNASGLGGNFLRQLSQGFPSDAVGNAPSAPEAPR